MILKSIEFIKTHKELVLFIAIGCVSFVFASCKEESAQTAPHEETNSEVATFIPKGFSLVPLEIANYQTLDSIFGPFGVVDLYVQDLSSKNFSRFVARHVKLIRAPKNPSHFAALVPSQDISKLMRYSGPFFAVIQNPKTTGTQFEHEKRQKTSRIHFNLGE